MLDGDDTEPALCLCDTVPSTRNDSCLGKKKSSSYCNNVIVAGTSKLLNLMAMQTVLDCWRAKQAQLRTMNTLLIFIGVSEASLSKPHTREI